MKPKFKVRQSDPHINTITILQATKDCLLIHVDFASKHLKFDGFGGSYVVPEFYFTCLESDSDPTTRISVHNLPPSWKDFRTAVSLQKYSATICLIRVAPDHGSKWDQWTDELGHSRE